MSTASVQVTLDTTPPRLAFSAPEPDSVTANATVNVSGIINDIVVGTINPLQATVFVNNVQAQVSNRSFFVPGLPLTVGPNVIRAVATDRSGNSTTTQMTVTRVPAGTGAITDAVADVPQSRVLRQVANGVAVRMAVLEAMLG